MEEKVELPLEKWTRIYIKMREKKAELSHELEEKIAKVERDMQTIKTAILDHMKEIQATLAGELQRAMVDLRDKQSALVQAEKRLAAKEGVGKIPLKVENVGTQTTAPNAEAMGLGPSRRIGLWSTILDGRFSEPQLEFVVAHELAHHKHKDLWKGMGW